MKYYINRISVGGIKNIKNPIELNFFNKTISSPIFLEGSNVKAIYGANGSGKSAIIHAIDIYKNLISTKGYLFTENGKNKLLELINKEGNNFTIKVDFICFNNEKKQLLKFRHELSLKKINDEFYLEYEKLINILTKTEKVMVHVFKGEIKEFGFDENIKMIVSNRLDKRSIVDVLLEEYFKEQTKLTIEKLGFLKHFMDFADVIFIRTEDIDKHELFLSTRKKASIQDSKKENVFSYSINRRYNYVTPHQNKDLFFRYIKMMERFIKIFKPDLQEIRPETKEDRENIYVELYFIYDGYKVFLEFESAGIKKLTQLYMLFAIKEAGGIVFIDELDANINDVYLIKLLEYFKESNKGQLVFTTHNISPMEVLDSSKHSIDFITEKGQITSWVKNGNYKAASIYQSGQIKGLPFNIYPFDFVGIFEDYKK